MAHFCRCPFSRWQITLTFCGRRSFDSFLYDPLDQMPKSTSHYKHKKGRNAGNPMVLKGSKKKPMNTNPHAPKRPLSAFMFFCEEWEKLIKEENPDASSLEHGKLIGARWKALGDLDREYYLKQAAADKERYDIELSLLVDPQDHSGDEDASQPRPVKSGHREK
ncbi:high mobility group box domain-containing protein [Cantharellus anzutake]|uniref:high mobility group box domain-containing protein n=1 Tax=Cantharellus anzutake TaxID=1750568 RepID=UPI00190618A5|nr:high mobility group box domain-containing protein [Cantharellus anzutake]KAF8335684.1 high mobility group box domain-containing protein [Cantharellus anzutake]